MNTKYFVTPMFQVDKLHDTIEDAMQEVADTYVKHPFREDSDARLVLKVERIVYPKVMDIQYDDLPEDRINKVLEDRKVKEDRMNNMFLDMFN